MIKTIATATVAFSAGAASTVAALFAMVFLEEHQDRTFINHETYNGETYKPWMPMKDIPGVLVIMPVRDIMQCDCTQCEWMKSA